MYRTLSFCVLLCTSIDLYTQPIELLQLRGDRIAQWAYVEGDEFNGEELDLDTWRRAYPWGRNLGNHLLQYYDNENAFVEDGRLIMEAIEEDTLAKGIPYWKADTTLNDGTRNERMFKYTSGMVFSKKQYYQGLFEAKIKNVEGKGYFPAFWLYGANPNEELDIMESKGERPESFHVDMHCPSGCSNYKKFLWWKRKSYGDWIDTGKDLTEDFHLFAGEWVPGEVVFYFDDKAVNQWAGNLYHPANIIINNALSGREGKGSFDGAVDQSTPFPGRFEVDYVRIYKRIDEGWEVIQEARATSKGRQKKKNRRKIGQRVSATARVYLEGDQLRVTVKGEDADKFEFDLVDSSGNSIRELDQNVNGGFSTKLTVFEDRPIMLRTRANGFSSHTKIDR